MRYQRGALPQYMRVLAPLLLGFSILALWAIATAGGVIEAWRLPSPQAVAQRAYELLSDTRTWYQIGVTFLEAALGCIIGVVVALPLAIATYSSRILGAALEPFIGASQALPAIAIAPLLVLWLGYGIGAISALCALMVFFPILIATVVGLKTLDPEIIQAASLDGAAGLTMLRSMMLPLAAPAILSGLRNGFALSFTGAIVGEMVMGGQGLGQILTQSRQSLDTAAMFVIIAVLCLLSTTVYHLILRYEARVIAERFA